MARTKPSPGRLACLGALAGGPALRDDGGRALHPRAVGGLLTGLALMFATGRLVSV